MELDETRRTQLANFIELFKGRGDCYGAEHGGCVKEPLTKVEFRHHLTDGPYIGVYPAIPQGVHPSICVWGCSDIDVESLESARLLQRTLDMAGVTAWVERSRSKGYHVWVFASAPVPAENMRRMFLVAHQVADLPAREVNPKQSDVSITKVGNYVRLPYPNAFVNNPIRRVMLDDQDNPMPLGDFLQVAISSRVSPDKIGSLAELYVEPERVTSVIDYGIPTSVSDALMFAPSLVRRLHERGPLPGHDRSRSLVFMAFSCQEAGMTPSMCHAIVADADKRWGKYTAKGQLQEINKIVERAYERR